jgi:uncharacterized protein with HEPN domain
MPLRDTAFLDHMVVAMERIAQLIARTNRETFDSDWVIQNAIIREMEILGEAAGRISREFTEAHAEIPWREITSMRNKLIHDYFVVDLGIVWHTATVDVPEIAPRIRIAARSLSPEDPQ